jgi:hypothetical protein
MPRKIIVSVLILIFCYNVFGYYVVYRVHSFRIKKEIKRKIKRSVPQSELTVFTFSKGESEDLIWIENHEFRLDGKMYDVVRKETKNNSITYHCINDTQEEVLFTNLDRHTKQFTDIQNSGDQHSKELITIMSKDYFQSHEEYKFPDYSPDKFYTHHSEKEKYDIYIDTDFPPPRC